MPPKKKSTTLECVYCHEGVTVGPDDQHVHCTHCGGAFALNYEHGEAAEPEEPPAEEE